MRLDPTVCAILAVALIGCGDDKSSDSDSDSDSDEGGRAGSGGSRASGGTRANDGGRAGSGGNGGTRASNGGSAGRAGANAGSGGRVGGGGSPSTPGGTPTIGRCSVFPADNPWNQDVSALPVHPSSDAFIASIGRDANVHPDFGTEWEGAPIGIPYTTVSSGQSRVPIEYTAYGDESDPGPFPVPPAAPIEGGPDADGDRHVLVIDTDECMLYELYRAFPINNGASWEADSGAVFDLSQNDEHPFTFTSADAAGLPIFPGLVRYDEVVLDGKLEHAARFTVQRSRAALIPPARHYASNSEDPNRPPMGLRVRMKASYDCSGYSEIAQVICTGLKRYGMILADNGSNWYISGAPDPRWDDDALNDLKDIPGSAFEAVDTGEIETY